MGILGGRIGYWMLRKVAPRGHVAPESESSAPDSKLKLFFGDDFFDRIKGKTVVDFGCGPGTQAVEMAVMGAGRVVGLDIQQRALVSAAELARRHSVSDRCTFATGTGEKTADIIISKDAFEHFSDLPAILSQMSLLLKPGGYVLAAFGPTWLHPYGGHLFSAFPWAHLVFTERALIRWRADFKSDGATRFSEVEGGLNQMTIRRFEQIVDESPLRLEYLECLPIKGIPLLKSPILREFGSSIVCCKLIARDPKPVRGADQRRGRRAAPAEHRL